MKITNKSLGLQMTFSALVVIAIGLYTIAHLLFHAYIDLPFGWETWKYHLTETEFLAGLAILLMGIWILYRAIRRLRM